MRYVFINTLICIGIITNVSAMDQSPQVNQQLQLRKIYYSEESFVTYEKSSWKRTAEMRSKKKIVILTPDEDSRYRGNFMVTSKEIHQLDNTTFGVRNIYEPSKPVAFVVGSMLIGAALWYLFGNNLASQTQ